MYDDDEDQSGAWDAWDDDDENADSAMAVEVYAVDVEIVDFPDAQPAPLIIRGGSGMSATTVHAAPRRRSLAMQFAVVAIAACIVLSTLFSLGGLGTSASIGNANPFTLLANAFIAAQPKALYHLYTAQPGDTFESIAAKFGVQVNGIFELNHLYLDTNLIVGTAYEIPYDPAYGADFQPPYRPGVDETGHLTPEGDVIIKTTYASQFSAVAGRTNPGGYCPAGYGTWAGNPALYGFINFDQPKTGPYHSSITQQFKSSHDGIDISTAVLSTPVYAAQMGVVVFAGYDGGGGGWTVKIAHCGWVATSYAHMVPNSLRVKPGDRVTQGETIGLQGQSGDALGVHVHFMMWWQNIPIDGICGYPHGLDGETLADEGAAQYNGCPPNLKTLVPFHWGK